MIKWKNICTSRCAIDSCYDWIEENLTDTNFIKIITNLGFKEDALQIKKYLMRHNRKNLKQNMIRGLKRNRS